MLFAAPHSVGPVQMERVHLDVEMSIRDGWSLASMLAVHLPVARGMTTSEMLCCVGKPAWRIPICPLAGSITFRTLVTTVSRVDTTNRALHNSHW